MDKLPSRDERAGETPAPQPWREDLIRELARRKIPRAWQARLLEELDDHLSDLKEEMMSTTAEHIPSPEERLGKPHELAESAATEYRRLGFFARRPVLTYFVGPADRGDTGGICGVSVGVHVPHGLGPGRRRGSVRKRPEPTATVVNGLVWRRQFSRSRFVPFALLAGDVLLVRPPARSWLAVCAFRLHWWWRSMRRFFDHPAIPHRQRSGLADDGLCDSPQRTDELPPSRGALGCGAALYLADVRRAVFTVHPRLALKSPHLNRSRQ